MADQGLLSELPFPVDLRPSQGTPQDMSTRGLDDENRPRLLTCGSPSPSPSPAAAAAASPMDVDDLLSEILLRLAPLPSSLPRASLVCTRWRRLVTDPGFLRRYRAHHWKPLGVFFARGNKDLSFSFFSGSPTRGPELFSVRVPRACHDNGGGGGGGNNGGCSWDISGCRHGRVVLVNSSGYGCGIRQILVWDPVTGEDHLIPGVSKIWESNPSPHGLSMHAAVICAAASGHHRGRQPFKLALAWNDRSGSASICVYSSETGVWGDVVSAAIPPLFTVGRGNVLVGNTLYWILFGSRSRVRVLEFDLGSQDLSVIEVPPDAIDRDNHRGIFLCTMAKGGGLSLMVMSENLRGQLWVWEKTADGVSRWMLGGTIELDMLLSLRSEGNRSVLWLEGDDNVMFVSTYKGVFMVCLQSMQFEEIFENGTVGQWSNPFKYLYAPGDISPQGVAGSGGVQGRGPALGDVARLKQNDAHVGWQGGSPIW